MLDKLIYNDLYEEIDREMSDSNIGARKAQNVRNHLFIIYGVINSVVKGEGDGIHLQIYDLVKAFDSLWLEDTSNDLYNTMKEEKRDDKLALLYKSNETNLVSVKTSVGYTDRINIPRIVQQGGTWGPLSCSNSIDSVGKQCETESDKSYLYKNRVKVIPLGMVDDVMAVAKCGMDSIIINSFINTKNEKKNLVFHTKDKTGKLCRYI